MTYFYILLKEWKMFLISILSFAIVILLLTGNRLESEKTKIENSFSNYKKDQAILIEKYNAEAKRKELVWASKITEAERNATKKIIEANDARRSAESAASRLSKQLSTANQRLSEATRETAIAYATTTNSVLDSCIAEYRVMAEKADGHAIDAERLINSFPTE